MRLIDADELLKLIPPEEVCSRFVVANAPTIEPERKNGRWTKAYDGNDGHVKCTGCFKTYDWISQAQYYNYCPNCGADMRGESDDIPIEYFESGGK